MESRAKLFGHPVHPMLIVFPLGLLITSLVFDVIRMSSGNGTWSVVAFYRIGAGGVGGLLAAVFGLIDWLAIPRNTRAKTLGLWHGGGNVVVVALFAVSWLMRQYVERGRILYHRCRNRRRSARRPRARPDPPNRREILSEISDQRHVPGHRNL